MEREFQRAARDRVAVEFENYYAPWQRWFHIKACPAPGESLSVFFEDVTDRKRADQERTELLERERAARAEAETLNEISRAVLAERDIEKLVQLITDAATKLTGAKFGSFFYNVTDASGESYVLYTLSGVPREAFSQFPLPRNTPVFAPDISWHRSRPQRRYHERSALREDGSPLRHAEGASARLQLPGRACQVSRRRSFRRIFFGHPEPGKFGEGAERLIVGLAAHAAVAIENAREFEKRRRTEDLLRQSEKRFREIIDSLPAAIYTTDAEGQAYPFQRSRRHSFRTGSRA